MKPVLFVTGHAPAYRAGALAALHERVGIELALFGGERRRRRHAGPEPLEELPVPARHAGPRELYALAAGGGYRAVVCPTGGRAALLATWAGARRARVPLILWASLWAHPRTLAHSFSYIGLRRLYRSADAVVTYGPHVSAYVAAHGAKNIFVAPQAVDNAFWGSSEVSAPSMPGWPAGPGLTRFLFVGRPDPEKGLAVLLQAWSRTGLQPQQAALVLAGPGAAASGGARGVFAMGRLSPVQLRDVYAACEVLVVPSLATREFREPWGLVVNEAMARGLAVIASDAVGAAAGGLVRDGESGLVVASGDPDALAAAISRLAGAPELREAMGREGRRSVAAYTYEAWAESFSLALSSVGAPQPGPAGSVDWSG